MYSSKPNQKYVYYNSLFMSVSVDFKLLRKRGDKKSNSDVLYRVYSLKSLKRLTTVRVAELSVCII